MSRQQRNILNNNEKETLKRHLIDGEDNIYLNKIKNLTTEQSISISDIINTPLDRPGKTALHILSARKNNAAITMINEVIENGANVNQADNRKWTALHHAATNGNLEVSALLLKYGAAINATLKNGNTPLHLAAKKITLPETRKDKYRHVYKLLLDKHANENAKNNKGQTSEQLKPERPELDAHTQKSVQDVIEEEENKETLVNALLEDKDFEWYWDNVTKFIYNDILNAVEDREVNPDKGTIITAIINTPLDDNGNTALHLLSKSITPDHNLRNTIVRLIGSGANIHQTAKDGYTALHYAAEAGNQEIVKSLWDYMADVNAETVNGEMPLDLAEKNGHQDIVIFLAEKSSDKKAINDNEEITEPKFENDAPNSSMQSEFQSSDHDEDPTSSKDETNQDGRSASAESHAPAPHVVVKRGLFRTKIKVEEYSLERENETSEPFDHCL